MGCWVGFCMVCWVVFVVAVSVGAEHQEVASQNVVAFTYHWYGNKSRGFKHWDHELVPHWNEITRQQFKHGKGFFSPPTKIASNIFPKRGCYDSLDLDILVDQFKELIKGGVGVIAASWWGPNSGGDSQGIESDEAFATILQAAQIAKIKVAFHLEPFPNMTPSRVYENIRYILDSYGHSDALFRDSTGRALMFCYDSYHINTEGWASLLKTSQNPPPNNENNNNENDNANGESSNGISIRGTKYDSKMIALALTESDVVEAAKAGFDGAYSYFASPLVSYAANPRNWANLVSKANSLGIEFVPCVSPGYNDTTIRPWNAPTTIAREGTKTYNTTWARAILSNAKTIAITSFNEWGEGTAIESYAVRSRDGRFSTADVFPNCGDFERGASGENTALTAEPLQEEEEEEFENGNGQESDEHNNQKEREEVWYDEPCAKEGRSGDCYVLVTREWVDRFENGWREHHVKHEL